MHALTPRQDGKAALEHLWLLIVLALAYSASIVFVIGVHRPNADTVWDGVAAVLLLGTLVTVVVLSWRDIYTFGGLMPWRRIPIALRILLAAGLIGAALLLWVPVVLFLPPIQIVRGFADLARTRMSNSAIKRERDDRTMSAAEIGDALESEIAKVRSQLPTDVVGKLERIKATILDILPRAEDLGPEELFVVKRTAVDYLPVAIHSYLKLPRAYAAKRPIASGKTALQLLNDDLELIETKLSDISEAIHRRDSDALIAHNRFLEDKFGRSSLTLPTG